MICSMAVNIRSFNSDSFELGLKQRKWNHRHNPLIKLPLSALAQTDFRLKRFLCSPVPHACVCISLLKNFKLTPIEILLLVFTLYLCVALSSEHFLELGVMEISLHLGQLEKISLRLVHTMCVCVAPIRMFWNGQNGDLGQLENMEKNFSLRLVHTLCVCGFSP